MAKCFMRADGVFQFRHDAIEEEMNPIPEGVAFIDFDEDAAPSLVADLRAHADQYTVAGGQLRKNGQAVALPADGDRAAIRKAASQAIADNQAFLAIGSPTNAQTLAQVRALTRQTNQIIKRLVQLDSVKG